VRGRYDQGLRFGEYRVRKEILSDLQQRHADLREVVRHVRDMIDQLHFVSVEYPHRGCEIMTKDLEMLGNELREALEKA